MKISRRKFLKILGAVPIVAAVPAVIAKEKLVPAFYNGMEFKFKSKNENTGAATLNINDLGEKPIVFQDGQPITISGAANPAYNGEYTITVKDKFTHPMLNAWADITGVRRKPNESDEDLRKRIMKKIRDRG